MQEEAKQTIEQSESVENEFEDDDQGKTYREQAKNMDTRLEQKVTSFYRVLPTLFIIVVLCCLAQLGMCRFYSNLINWKTYKTPCH